MPLDIKQNGFAEVNEQSEVNEGVEGEVRDSESSENLEDIEAYRVALNNYSGF